MTYNEMLDYCLGGEEFSTGVLKYSESGKSHFTDVRKLFLFDLWAFAIGAAIICVLLLISRKAGIKPSLVLGRGVCFWAGIVPGILFIIIGGLSSIDFDRAFEIFHSVFFPGKDNWLFDPGEDEIIRILPQTFFMNCAILILTILVLCCLALIIYDLTSHKRKTGPTKT